MEEEIINFFTIVVGLIIVGIIAQIISTIWLYFDASEHGESPVAWALLSICFNFILIVPIYLFFFRTNGKIPCQHCGIWFKPLGHNCPHCGADIQ